MSKRSAASRLSRLHNEQVAELLPRIVKPILAAGGSYKDILVLLESLNAGVVAFIGNGTGDAKVLQHVADGAAARVESMRADVRRMMH